MIRIAFAFALASGLGACAPPAPVAPEVTQANWDDALARLAELRASFPKKPYTEQLSVSFFEPITRRHFDGRGAVGVDPGRAMRMILVGPAGEPALDVWVTRDAWRLVVPAAHVARRGGRESPPGSPIGFFRAWFVDPLGGHLLALGRDRELIVRDDDGGTLHIGDGHIVRRRGTQTEIFSFDRTHAKYVHATSGLEVEITVGEMQREPPDPEAFVDPDRGGAR